MTIQKQGSSYMTKRGVEMVQINLAVQSDVAEKFNQLCNGLSRSVIFTQLVDEKINKLNLATKLTQKTTEKKKFSILD